MTSLLPLDTWRDIMGIHPTHFWQIADNASLRVSSECNSLVFENNWQDADMVGRKSIRRAIERAETTLRNYLGFSVAPRYVEETVPWPRYNQPNMYRHHALDATGRWVSVQLGEGHVQQIGVEALSAISTNAAATYSDDDGDGYDETWTISAATSVTDVNQIAVYFNSTDRYDGAVATDVAAMADWRIQPVRVSISGGTVTVKGSRWIVVKPNKYRGFTAPQLSPTDAANFVTSLDIYRRYTNVDGETVDNAQAVLVWETTPCSGWWCSCDGGTYTPSDSSSDPAAVAKAIARVGIRNALTGEVTPGEAVRNATTGIWSDVRFDTGYEPDKVIIRYLAGLPLVNQQMTREWQIVVARLAAAELTHPICACDAANRELSRWQFDLARSGGANDEAYGAITQEDLNNPFGTRRGAVDAWKRVKNLRNLRGFTP